jgi:hypothetical protein
MSSWGTEVHTWFLEGALTISAIFNLASIATCRGILLNAGTNDKKNAWWPCTSACHSFSWYACSLNSEALCQNWCQLLSWRSNGLFISCSLTNIFVEVLTLPFTTTKSSVIPCRKACRSVSVNFAVLFSTVSSLVHSVLRALCVILSSSRRANVGWSTSTSFGVWEQELELMVEHVQFLIVGSLPCFRLRHLSMAPHKVVPDSFPLLYQLLCWNKWVNFSICFSCTWPQGWILEIWNLISRCHRKQFRV